MTVDDVVRTESVFKCEDFQIKFLNFWNSGKPVSVIWNSPPSAWQTQWDLLLIVWQVDMKLSTRNSSMTKETEQHLRDSSLHWDCMSTRTLWAENLRKLLTDSRQGRCLNASRAWAASRSLSPSPPYAVSLICFFCEVLWPFCIRPFTYSKISRFHSLFFTKLDRERLFRLTPEKSGYRWWCDSENGLSFIPHEDWACLSILLLKLLNLDFLKADCWLCYWDSEESAR